MTAAQPGWYPDPSGQTGLRWWDGDAWTAATREAAPAAPAAPPPPPPPPSPTDDSGPAISDTPTSQTPTVVPGATTAPIAVTPPTPPPASSPGSFGEWAPSATGFAAPGYASAPFAPSSPSARLGFPGQDPVVPPGAAGAPDEPTGPRNWLAWGAAGAGVAIIIALAVFLVASVLGTQTSPPSSQGLSSNGATSTTGGSGSTSSTATTAPPTTSTTTPGGPPAGPAGSVRYTDPTGTYSVSVGSDWVRSSSGVNGIPVWYIGSAGNAASPASFDVATETLSVQMGLQQFVQYAEEGLARYAAFHLLSTANITLDDGVPATVIRYTNEEIRGVQLQGEAVVAVSSTNAVIETVTATPAQASSVFAAADPYLRTLHLN